MLLLPVHGLLFSRPLTPLQRSCHFWAPHQAVQLLVHPGLADLCCFFVKSIEQDLADGNSNKTKQQKKNKKTQEGGQLQLAANNLSQVLFFKIGIHHYSKEDHSVGQKPPCKEKQCIFLNTE